MKSMLPSVSIFAGIFFVAVNTWSAFEVLVRGQYEGELGGPLSNLVFGVIFSIGLVIVVTAGYCMLSIVARKFFNRRLSQAGGAVATLVAILLTLGAISGGFLDKLPLRNLMGILAWYFFVGLVSGCVALITGLAERTA